MANIAYVSILSRSLFDPLLDRGNFSLAFGQHFVAQKSYLDRHAGVCKKLGKFARMSFLGLKVVIGLVLI